MQNIHVSYSPLSKHICVVRTGRNPNVALAQREASKDVFCALIAYMMDDSPRGATQDVRIGDQWYQIAVKPIAKAIEEERNDENRSD